jgi:hypothetical protein
MDDDFDYEEVPKEALVSNKPKRTRASKFTEEEAKADAEAKARVSFYGNTYPLSKAKDWMCYKIYDPAGKESAYHGKIPCSDAWININQTEYHNFDATYAECCICKIYVSRHLLITSVEGYFFFPNANKDNGKFVKSGYRGSGSAYPWFLKENGVEAIIADSRVLISKKQTSHHFFRCEISNELVHVDSGYKIYSVRGHDIRHKTVWRGAVNMADSTICACGNCGNVFSINELIATGSREVRCWPCVKNDRSFRIAAHDAAFSREQMRQKIKRMGYKVGENGELVLDNKRADHIDLTKRTYGWEIETEIIPWPDEPSKKPSAIPYNKTRKGIASDIVSRFGGGDYIGIKEDGSLQLNGKYSENYTPFAGFEIVSRPADFESHMMMLGDALGRDGGEKINPRCKAWEVSTCGFHVHVGRAELTSYQIGLIVMFINAKENRKFVYAIAGRKGNVYCTYNSGLDVSSAIHPERVVSPNEARGRDASRRVAVNLSNPATIEFRIFRGTVNIRHVMRNLEFVDALCAYCESGVSIKDIKDVSVFIRFVASDRKRWRLLYDWMVVRGMIKKPKGKLGEVAEPEPMEDGDADHSPQEPSLSPPARGAILRATPITIAEAQANGQLNSDDWLRPIQPVTRRAPRQSSPSALDALNSSERVFSNLRPTHLDGFHGPTGNVAGLPPPQPEPTQAPSVSAEEALAEINGQAGLQRARVSRIIFDSLTTDST